MPEDPRGSNVTAGTCPAPDTLRAFLDERLPVVAHGEVLDHVASCVACDEKLAELSRSGSVALLGAAAVPRDPDPAGAEFAERLAARRPPRRPLPRVAPAIPGIVELEPVGRGGMGVVYRGRDAATGALVAVKVMWSVGGLTDAAHVRARREAETLARIDDPGIVRVIRAGRCDGGPLEPEGVPYIVMEWIDGETLQSRVGRRALSTTQAATVIRDLGRVLARVHALGIVHRDVKPANVFLIPGRKPGARATPKLVDFGLARHESADGFSIGSREIAGTPGYMAPEQARSDGALGPVGPASDVYGLGATLFFLLVGRPPAAVSGDELSSTSTSSQRLDWQAGGRRNVPVDLRTIVEKCLRPSPVGRYSSAGEVADDLDRFRQGLPIRARQASAVERLVTWTRRHPGWCAAVLMATLLLGVAVTGTWLHTARLGHANRLANEARGTAQSALTQLTGGWVQRMMTRGTALDSADRAFLGEVRDLYRGWTVAADPVGALRFRAEGLGQIARIFANLDEGDEAITLFDEALAALDDYERRGGDASAVTSLRLLLLRDQTQMFMRYRGGPRAAELVDRMQNLLDDPAAARARSATDRSIVLLARLGALILAIDASASSLPGGAPTQALAAVEQLLDELEDLERHHAADPAAATGKVEGLIAAATALSPVTGPAVAVARLRQAADCAARAFDRFDGAPHDVRDRFRRHRLLALATRCDIELASGAAADSLASARDLVELTREPMEREETADLFYRGEHVEAVIREAKAAAAMGAGGESIGPLERAVELAARSVTEQPALFVHTGRLAKALQCQSSVLEAVGRTAEAAASARRIAVTLVPWRDSPARAEWTWVAIEGAHTRSAQLRIDAGDLRGAVDDYAKLLAIAPAERRPEAARRLLAAARAAGRSDAVAEALAAILRHDPQARAEVIGTLGIDLGSESPPSEAAVPRE